MGKPLRHATVLFLLGLLAMASLLGSESAGPLGGPAEEDWLMQARSNFDADIELAAEDGAINEAAGAAGAMAEQAPSELLLAAAAAGVLASDRAVGRAGDVQGSSIVAGTQAARDGTTPQGRVGASPERVESTAQQAATAQTGSALQDRPLIVTHVVQRGETLWDIANRYGIDVDTIVAANDLVDINRLQVGQELTILTIRGAVHTVQRGESLWDIARAYGVSMDEITSLNRLSDPSRLQVGQRLVIPGAQAQAIAARREAVVQNGQLLRNFDWPVQGGRISSRFGPRWGRMHQGLDIAVPTGTPVRAAAAGTVTYAGPMGSYGNLVILDHGNRVETRYAHNSRIVVRVGQKVKRGEIIAYSGNTGNSTGPHLHFEIRYRGTAVDPDKYLKR
ncbi:MAG TPA: peptidoglycan DD-metalloendopeptidase family protein [Limnochordales bacterium]